MRESWVEAQFAEINNFSPRTVNPAESPTERFELYSVPSFPTREPEVLLGSAIGSTKQIVEPGDVLVCKINPRINRVWEVGQRRGQQQIASSEWIVMRPTGLNARFLRHYFTSPGFRELICEGVTGVGGSLTRAQPRRVATFKLLLAPLNEQRRIADKLDAVLARVDACRERLDRMPDILKRFREAVLAAATSGRLTEDWRATHSGRETSRWESVTLDELLQAKPRNGYSPRAVEHATSVKSLSLTATTSGRFLPHHFKYVDETIPRDSHLWLQPGDILIQRANTIENVGVSAIYDGPPSGFIYPDLMMKCRANARVLTTYLHYILRSEPVRRHFRDRATGTAGNMPKINQETVLSAPALVPPIVEQGEIIRRAEILFAGADQLEARCRAARTLVVSLTPALFAKAFRGQLVTPDPNDERASVLLERVRASHSLGPAVASQPAITRTGRTSRRSTGRLTQGPNSRRRVV